MALSKRIVKCIEGRLYEWGYSLQDSPQPVLSRPLDSIRGDKYGKKLSPQEAYVMRQYCISLDGHTIEKAMQSMTKDQKDLLTHRYVAGQEWNQISENIGKEYRTCFRLRDDVLLILAYEFGYLAQREHHKQAQRA